MRSEGNEDVRDLAVALIKASNLADAAQASRPTNVHPRIIKAARRLRELRTILSGMATELLGMAAELDS